MKKINNIDYIKECSKKHNNKYNYSLTEYMGVANKVSIICPEHGVFYKIARDHKRGKGCPECSKKDKYEKYKLTKLEFVSRSKSKHGDKYGYSKVKYKSLKDKVTIICPEHGEFEQRPSVHISGEGCKFCYFKKYGESQRLTTIELISKFKEIHDDKYDYSKVEYNGYKENVTIICSKHGEFEQLVESHLHGGDCVKCFSKTSKTELEVRDFISELNISYDENNRDIIKPLELDIYIPTHDIAIEFNGLYWHSEKFIDNDYHLNKTNMCEEKGVQLIHVFEDEWLFKKDIVKSRLKNILGLTDKRIYGRKCTIKEVPTNIKTTFLNDNHIQGAVGSKVNIGLYYDDELVSIMTFGKRPVFNSYEYELIRFCNKLDTTVIGGASKLLKYFIKTYEPKEIISYADRRWSTGNLYDNLSFDFIENTKANWFIINNGIREHRVKYQKHKLIEQGYDKDKTAHQICLDNGLYRIYDCGTKKYSLIIN